LSLKVPFHPILFAAYPVLALYSLNTALFPAIDIVLPLVLVIGSVCVFWAILSLILRSPARGAAGASIAVLGVFAFGHLWDQINKVRWLAEEVYSRESFLWYWLPFWLGAIILACWKWKRSEQLIPVTNLVGIALTAMPAVSICASWYSTWRGTTVHEVGYNLAKLDTSVRPNIYYIILDGYGRSDALQRVIGVSNGWFIKGLEDRGFYVARNGRSNYCETELSLASSLNLDYLPKVLPSLNPAWDDRGVLDSLIDRNFVAKYLRRLGYGYEAMTSGFPAVHPRSADIWLQDTKGVSLFAGALIGETPFPIETTFGGMSQFTARRIMLRSAIENLVKSTSDTIQPRFVFAHVLAPHPPFVFGPNGEEVRPKKMGFTLVDGNHFYENGGTPEQYAKGYAGQATYISKLILAAVDRILKANPDPPVIIIQGDHGSKMRLDQELVNKTDLNECFPNLNAYFVPAKVRAKLYDGITPVNSFRLLFNGLFGDHFPVLPDRSYYSGWSTPFQFIEVTNRIKTVSSTRPTPSSPAKP
jgi:hypothetical protein